MTLSEAYKQGYLAHSLQSQECMYKADTTEYYDWWEGYDDAESAWEDACDE